MDTFRTDTMSRWEESEKPMIHHKIENDVLHVTVVGLIGISELVAYATAHIDDWSSCPGLVWDLREMEFFEVSLDSLRGMSEEFAQVNAARAGGRTALLVKKRDDILGKMIVDLAISQDGRIEHRVFLSIEDALEWLNQSA